MIVSASARARRDERGDERVAVAEQALPGGPQLERERRVDHVAARQPEVQVAALGPDRLGDLADERDDVVVGRPLDLGDPGDVDGGPRLDGRERVGRHEAPADLGPGDGDLDPEHRLEAGLVGPDRAHLGQRVARDHRPTPTGTAPDAMSWRRWTPSNEMASAASLGGVARVGQARTPADDREDPAAVRLEGAVVAPAGPGMEDERPLGPAASTRPLIRSPRDEAAG